MIKLESVSLSLLVLLSAKGRNVNYDDICALFRKTFYFSARFESKDINKRIPQGDWEVFKSQKLGNTIINYTNEEENWRGIWRHLVNSVIVLDSF